MYNLQLKTSYQLMLLVVSPHGFLTKRYCASNLVYSMDLLTDSLKSNIDRSSTKYKSLTQEIWTIEKYVIQKYLYSKIKFKPNFH
ncbi:hypothetical protein BpHYR1_000138 [Brachionus plicatilis]|uniref:Uncharacterized protein n=1 Tax=Brachionus plicatilis TaxID=10195 RepID=A0A3M7SCR9_BRAPC|nr:hypothetical protein BpHYR1_000138 [Brachionus plicatilis]